MTDTVHKHDSAAPVSAAIGKLCSLWCGTLALTIVFLLGVCTGVEAPTALLRGGIACVAGLVLGRWIGSFIGRHLAPVLVRESTPRANR
ncbi:MAG: hypothetical protein EXS14_10375 [Planctomycetes bacterium]|nr:hypothetical protein [Planctomycetota bacterium]